MENFKSLEILYEDPFCVAVNKPIGLPSVAHADKPTQVTAESLIQSTHPGATPVHRLDNGTSGVLLFAKFPEIYLKLRNSFQNQLVKKMYWAWVEHSPENLTTLQKLTLPYVIQNPLARHPKSAKRVIVLPLDPLHAKKLSFRGKPMPAKTIIHGFELSQPAIKLNIEIITGFTHQIRAHLKFLGMPILGDQLYGKSQTEASTPRLALHAYSLSFQLEGKNISIKAPYEQAHVTPSGVGAL